MPCRCLVSLLVLLVAGSADADRRPNIVLLIGDDHGWPYAGFMGDDVVATPTLDRLAAEGTVFTHVQMPSSRCRPSLQTVLSGLHPEDWIAKRQALMKSRSIPIREEVQYYRTLPRELARRGYRSWEGGKMWEGTHRLAGFDAGMADYTESGAIRSDGDRLGREGWDPERCGPGRLRDEPCPALEPLRAFLDETADGAPFFLWFAPMLPHTPFDPSPEFTRPYLERGDLTLAEVVYYAQVTRLDALIAELLRELEDRGLLDETLIVYLSDNGWEIGQSVVDPGHGKLSLYELGTRTPVVFHWPGRIPRGVRRDDLAGAEDLFPTLLDYAGAEPLPDRRGRSLRRAIQTGAPVGIGSYVSFVRGSGTGPTGHFVRTADWRYLAYAGGHEELYAMAADPFEQVDLASDLPILTALFRRRVLGWRAERLIAPPRLELAGRVVDPSGQPLPGVGVRLATPVPLSVLTDGRGEFRFQNLPHATYRVAPGAGIADLSGALDVRLPVATLGSYETLVGEGAVAGLRAGTASLTGWVCSRSGTCAADTKVVLREEALGIEVSVLTDRDGRYRAENLPAGFYHLEAEAPPGYRPPHTEVTIVEPRAQFRDLTLRETT